MSSAAITHSESGHASAPPSTCRFGMIMFLASEGMLFAGLIAAYIVLRVSAPEWPPENAHALPWKLTGMNTLVLILSSFTYHWAEGAVKRGKSGLFWLFASIVLGSIFVGVQAYEWTYMYKHGVWFDTFGTYGSSFFVITGFHGAHVIVGVLLITWIFLKQLFGRVFTAERHSAMANVGLYWHFVDIVWVILYFILYIYGGPGK